MDGTIKQSRRFAELERLSDDYFRYHLASVMDETRDYLARKQGEEMKEYSTSLGGVLSMMASSAQPLNDPYQLLKVTGEWNSKTTEDYVEMCKEKIAASEDIQHDLAYMAGQWRDAVVKEIGRERYDELSEQLGGDLAYAYMDYRLEQQMIDKLVKDRMPKSSADYIIRKAAESSLFGLPQMLSRSPLAEEIEKRGEAAYRPSKVEQGAGWLLGASADTVMLGGAGSWAAFARFIGVDAAVSATMAHLEPEDPKSISVEQCISQGVFGSEHNVFEDFRREAATMTADKDSFTATANEQLKKQAGTDPLTGLRNRRQMIQYITEKRRKEPVMAFTIGMGDIDFFKRINDHWGHDCGDAVLVWITQHMSRELGEHAKLCRWGGEEFIFFVPDMKETK